MSESGPSTRRPLAHVAVGGMFAWCLAAAAAGAIDGIWAWRDSAQFLPSVAGRLGFVLFLTTAYALAGAVVGLILATAISLLLRHTQLGSLLAFTQRRRRQVRARDPRDALAGLSLVLAGIPTIAAVGAVSYQRAVHMLGQRKHLGLVVAVSMAVALGALLVAAVLTFVVARPIELGLRRAASSSRVAALLSSPRASLVAAAILLVGAGGVGVSMAWETLELLPLRGYWVTLLMAALVIPSLGIGRRAATSLSRRRPALRRSVPGALLVVIIALVLVTGSTPGVLKASPRYSGLGDGLTRVLRRISDFDGDGYSSLLGGGDCDNWNAEVHPGAVEIPDDGIDQNCVGGDPSTAARSHVPRFAALPQSVPDRLNVLLITVDTLRADHVGAYGYSRPTTPRLDGVASEGTLFANAWAHAPSTRYSIPAILTGRLPLDVRYDHSIRGWPGLSMDNTTIAEVLQQRGLSTGAVLNYWYFTPSRHLNQGYDEYDNHNQRLHKGVRGAGPAETSGTSSREQTDTAIKMLDKLTATAAPFHLWVHYYDPHYAYEKHAGVRDFGDGPRDLYDNEILFTDQQIGRLLDDLKRRGLYGRTVVVITGDHGEGFGEHGISQHGYHLYAAQTRVPLIIRVPGLPHQKVETPAGHIDILPTLANLVGAAPTADMMGHSLLDLISSGDGDAVDSRRVYQQLSYENNNEMRAAASRRCHVIFNVSPQTSWELYRIQSDPHERRDVIDDPGDCAAARRDLETWYDEAQIPPGASEALLPSNPEIEKALNIDFGDSVRLLEVGLPNGTIKAGTSFPVTFTFESRGTMRGGWKLFAHFESANQRFHSDHAPPRPIDWWRAGQFIRYTHNVTVPKAMKAGRFKLWIGLFKGNARQPARGDITIVDDRALVGSVQVRR